MVGRTMPTWLALWLATPVFCRCNTRMHAPSHIMPRQCGVRWCPLAFFLLLCIMGGASEYGCRGAPQLLQNSSAHASPRPRLAWQASVYFEHKGRARKRGNVQKTCRKPATQCRFRLISLHSDGALAGVAVMLRDGLCPVACKHTAARLGLEAQANRHTVVHVEGSRPGQTNHK